MEQISERDWKTFKRLRRIALERASQRILDECQCICSDSEATAHERYLRLTKTVDDRRNEVGTAFDDFRRSTAVLCLRAMDSAGLLKESELAELTEETRRRIELARGV